MVGTANSRATRTEGPTGVAQLREQVLHLLYRACTALDERRYRDWIELFAPDGRYVATSAENFENGWPLAVIDDNRSSMLDRAEMIEKYWTVEPARTRRMVGNVDIAVVSPERLNVRSAFVVYLTNPEGRVEIQATGSYRDELVHLDDWRFQRRTAVHDNDLLTHTVTYPL
ncbi:MAG TPA: aromatic-ring-hydroxylating dioxygenase subunit beta [Amycolatopsis sp.]|uniref:aromatic-ring-hydroxylating dioxygenase subunit beta n=1 Tax=Amycolatopsis sp. TaxID=37632 RepID=UPI002B48C911|nr:aromatic-ring-hydroxylating dioxygenase subunit beta [Amycolatopsis sp.]HKS49817.1 aromatic-ring-hydroxylating dioxygenase subunit beta [Amycolatopsis sp.]